MVSSSHSCTLIGEPERVTTAVMSLTLSPLSSRVITFLLISVTSCGQTSCRLGRFHRLVELSGHDVQAGVPELRVLQVDADDAAQLTRGLRPAGGQQLEVGGHEVGALG